MLASDTDRTPLVIIGGGAAGLMAACHAAALGLSAVLLERKHRVGSKVLMCGNGRCNLTSNLGAEAFIAAFGAELTDFLTPAIRAFTPANLQQWFAAHRLPVMCTRDGKVFPKSERAPDVVHCLSDTIRDGGVPLCLNAVVEDVTPAPHGFTVKAKSFRLEARHVLIATGGVSYPKTGSVGDGQRMAKQLGHRVSPYRPGLVGVAWTDPWLQSHQGAEFPGSQVRLLDGQDLLGETEGLDECERWGLGGGAISNATRLLSRANARHAILEISVGKNRAPLRLDPVRTRPLKEAMVTVGGVDLRDVSASTMQSRCTPGLYFAGEVLDIDGPTGGFNLTAAFATARLAVESVASELGISTTPTKRPGKRPRQNRSRYGRRARVHKNVIKGATSR